MQQVYQIITDHETLEDICINCGSIITNKDTNNAEKTQDSYSNKEISESKYRTTSGSYRTPTSLTRHDMGLSTVIGKTNRDASGQQIDIAMTNRIDRLRTWNTRSQFQNQKERNLHKAFIHLQRLRDQIGLPNSVIEKTAYIYRKVHEKRLTNGISIKVAITAALYIACRELEIPRTLKELAEISNTDEKDLSRFYRTVLLELDLKVPQDDPLKRIVKIANICKTSEKTKRYAIKLMNDILKKNLFTSKDPMGLAGAVICLASKKMERR